MNTTLLQATCGTKRPALASYRSATRERGIALVVALIFLLMLTILGVTVMSTASLESAMATNTQETNRAFHGAESAVQKIFAEKSYGTLIRVGDSKEDTVTYGGLTVKVTTEYKQQSETAGRSRSLSSIHGQRFAQSVFDYRAEASNGLTKARSTLNNGKGVATPKSQ